MSDSNPKVYGYIYRIYHENIYQKNTKGELISPCYIGKTEETIHKRFLGHKRDAKLAGGKITGGDGKLHAEMWAKNCKGFHVDELDVAYSPKELSEKESFYIKKYESISHGWNKIDASTSFVRRGENITVQIYGQERRFDSIAQMCRELDISGTSLQHWYNKKQLSLSDAVLKSIEGKKKEEQKKINQKVIVFKRTYQSINELARDIKINKHNLSATTIRKRIQGGLSPDDAIAKPKDRLIKNFDIKLPDGSVKNYESLKKAHKELTNLGVTNVPYSSLVTFISKGYTPEQAFGFESRPWEEIYKKCDELVNNQGYEYVGNKLPSSIPIIVDYEKKIYTTIKFFTKAFGLNYYTIAEKIQQGVTVAEILKKSGHLN